MICGNLWRGCGHFNHRRLSSGLDDGDAAAVKGLALIGAVGVVVGGVAIANTQDSSAAVSWNVKR